ncbi:hypothetical protein [Paraburkholderia sp. J69-2]|uniref:hypothetical protein n=1 Tax=Paraburkholderia sp. J69-2 TaxID=2805437 RepID=UPI0039EEE58D
MGNLGGIAAIATGFLMGPVRQRAHRRALLHDGRGVRSARGGGVLSPTVVVIAPAAFCLGYCASGLQKGVSALAVEFYPPALRSTGLGWGLGVGRRGAILGPMVPGLLLQAGWRPAPVFYLMAVSLLLGGTAIAFMQAWYQQRSLPAREGAGTLFAAHNNRPNPANRAPTR